MFKITATIHSSTAIAEMAAQCCTIEFLLSSVRRPTSNALFHSYLWE